MSSCYCVISREEALDTHRNHPFFASRWLHTTLKLSPLQISGDRGGIHYFSLSIATLYITIRPTLTSFPRYCTLRNFRATRRNISRLSAFVRISFDNSQMDDFSRLTSIDSYLLQEFLATVYNVHICYKNIICVHIYMYIYIYIYIYIKDYII